MVDEVSYPITPICNNNPARTSVPYVLCILRSEQPKFPFTATDESTLLLITFFVRLVDPYFRFLIMPCVRPAVRALVCCPETDNDTPIALT